MGGKVQQEKAKLVPRAVPSAAASLMFQEKTAHSAKQDGTSLFSAVKRKYPFKDIYIQVMAGGKWPTFQKCAMVITGEPGPSPLIIKESQLSSVGRGHNQSNLADHIGESQPGHLPLLWCFSGVPQLLKNGKCRIIVNSSCDIWCFSESLSFEGLQDKDFFLSYFMCAFNMFWSFVVGKHSWEHDLCS